MLVGGDSEGESDAPDADLFRQAMDGVEPLSEGNRREPWRPRLRPVPLDHVNPEDDEEELPDRLSLRQVTTEDFLSFCRPGVQHRTFLALQRGQLPIEWELDLHGLTLDLARGELSAFLHHCRRQRARCVLIIHGKGRNSEEGQPVLKQLVNVWLRQREQVLAFCSAPRQRGGTGATCVLLRAPDKGAKRHLTRDPAAP